MLIYRMQDYEGRGPFKPGLTKYWLQDSSRDFPAPSLIVPNLQKELQNLNKRRYHCGVGCISIEQLKLWFNKDEYDILKVMGYSPVCMEVNRVLYQDKYQAVFARKTKLSKDITLIHEFY